jgi:hypothetical protein
MVMISIQLASILRTDLPLDDDRRLLAAALHCLLWVLLYRAILRHFP